MSYKFTGFFKLNKRLDEATFLFLKDLSSTRRMSRNVDAAFGVEGEFYVHGNEYDSNIIDRNSSPKTQPGLHCDWVPTKDYTGIEWNGTEKTYQPVEWIEYIISRVLSPRGYVLDGEVEYWNTNYHNDSSYIEICDNVVNGKRLITDYSINKLLPIRGTFLPKSKSLPRINRVSTSRGGASVVTKTRKQTVKEQREEQERKLLAQIQLLEDQLKEKDKEIKRVAAVAEFPRKKLTVQEIMLEKLRGDAQFGGTLDDFKKFLKNLLD